jgi:hypothetical protein
VLPDGEVVPSSGVTAVVHLEVVAILVAVAEEMLSTSLGTSFPHVNFVARPIIQCSSAISALIQTTWEKRRVLMQHIHMELTQIAMRILEL